MNGRLSAWQVLRAKFPENEYVLVGEVSDAAGFSRSRSMDYLLINLWESRGLAVTGFEQKSNRSDWLRELKNPLKQENHFKYCDYFYLLTDKDDVAKEEEIPPTWGWYHINNKDILKTKKAAPKLNSVPITRSFLCAILKRAADKSGYVRVDSIQDKIDAAVKSERIRHGYEVDRKLKEYENIKEAVKAFEEASGIKISADRWDFDPKRTGEIVKVIREGGIENYEEQLKRLHGQVKNIYEKMSKGLSILKIENLQHDVE